MNILSACVALILLVSAFATSATNEVKPGIRFMLQNSGLNKMVDEGLPEFIQKAKETPFPDMSITEKVSIAGEVTVDLTNIHFTNLTINQAATKFEAPNGVSVAAQGITVGIALDFSFKQKSWPHASGTGDVSVSSNGASIQAGVLIGLRTDDEGKPFFTSKDVAISLGKLNVKIRGGGSVGWLLNFLEGLFSNQIRTALEKTMRDNIVSAIDGQLNDVIRDTPFVIPFKGAEFVEDLEIDVRLTSAPRIVEGASPALVIDDRVRVGVIGKSDEAPFQPIDLPTSPSSEANDFDLFVSQWVQNQALWQMYSNGLLKYRLTDDIIPPESPIHLNTKDLRNYIPELYEKFPDQLVVVDMAAVACPSVNFGTPVTTILNATLTFSVMDAAQKVIPAFDMSTYMEGSLSRFEVRAVPDGRALNISGTVEPFKIATRLIESYMGPVNVDRIRNTVTILLNSGVLPFINQEIGNGKLIELPQGLKVATVFFQLRPQLLALGGAVKYDPTTPSDVHPPHHERHGHEHPHPPPHHHHHHERHGHKHHRGPRGPKIGRIGGHHDHH